VLNIALRACGFTATLLHPPCPPACPAFVCATLPTIAPTRIATHTVRSANHYLLPSANGASCAACHLHHLWARVLLCIAVAAIHFPFYPLPACRRANRGRGKPLPMALSACTHCLLPGLNSVAAAGDRYAASVALRIRSGHVPNGRTSLRFLLLPYAAVALALQRHWSRRCTP